MSQSWTELLSVADKNSRSAAQELEEARRRREKLNQKANKSRPANDTAIKMILERRRREQEKLVDLFLEEQRLRKLHELKKQQKTTAQLKTQQQKSSPPKPPTSALTSTPKKPPANVKKKMPNVSYEDLMRYASLKTNKQPIPKELLHVSKSFQANTPLPSTSKPNTSLLSSKTTTSQPLSTTTNIKKSISSTSLKTTRTTSTVTKPNSTTKSSTQQKSNVDKSKSNVSGPLLNNVKSSARSASTTPPINSIRNGQKPSQNRTVIEQKSTPNQRLSTNVQRPTLPNQAANGRRPTVPSQIVNGQRPALPNQTVNGQRSRPPNQTMNGQRLPAPNRMMMNGRRPSNQTVRKRPVLDTDDEDDEEMRDFIVDDENDEYDYRKELQETLKTNFGFVKERYRAQFSDDDDDDLKDMESSYHRIEREEEISRRLGLKEDIDEVLREEAEKKKRLSQVKKRPKTAA
ncbi:unnamed protein product [Rotaria socialis]|uniref:Protein SPT2 homolog n=2 Tax=Rotaria socialis TaxID=392032 RepID=A0A818F0M8_9BILA|nr:unnamed protein product [Rotaria socialis]